jgi:antitoxin MazE
MPAYSKVTRHGQVTLPASVRKKLKIEEGDLIEIEIIDEKLVLVPKRLVDKNQSYFWTKEWQEAEQKADDDIKNNRIKVFETAEELFKDLD